MRYIAPALLCCLLVGRVRADEPAAAPPSTAAPAVAQLETPTPAPPPTAAPAMAVPPTAATIAKPPPKPPGRFYAYGSFALNVYTHLGATSTAKAADLTPASRGIIYQQVGFAYYFHPLLRAQLTVQFGETVSGLSSGSSPFTIFGFIPMLVATTHGYFGGLGVCLTPISYGKAPNFDAGIYTVNGYAVKLPHGLSIPLGVQVVFMLNQRFSAAITPTVALAARF